MKAAGYVDSLTVINGPEDGTEFALTQREFSIGRESNCAVNVRLDEAVENAHARGSAVGDGYRIRSTSGRSVFVNGRRATMLRSRVAKSGDILRVGHTELVLECSVDGLATRSRGLPFETDFAWALRGGVSVAGRILRGALRPAATLARAVVGGLFRRWKPLTAIAIVLAYIFVPGFGRWASHAFYIAYSSVFDLFR